MVGKVLENAKVRILTPCVVERVEDGWHTSSGEDDIPDHEILSVYVKDVVDGSRVFPITCDHMIVCYGQVANSPSGDYIRGKEELPENVYAVGDVLENKVKGIYISEVQGRNIVGRLLGNRSM